MKKAGMQSLAYFIVLFFCLMGSGKATGQIKETVYSSDIGNFWTAFDSVQAIKDTGRQIEVMQSLYIDKGTDGLKTFMQLRRFDAGKLVTSINKFPKFWQSIRNNTLTISSKLPVIETYIGKLKELYPDFRPAKIYFTISAIRAAGVVEDSVVFIGTEIAMGNQYTDVSEFPDKRLENFFRSKKTDNIVPVTIHECVHTQQRTEGKTLLGQSVYEGACDFITELVLGTPLNHSYLTYGRKNEKQLKEQFQQEMFAEDYSNWLYNGANTKTMGDLGYFMGYAICKSYYRHAKDKKEAIKHILHLNYADLAAMKEFLAASKYYKGILLLTTVN